MKTQEMQRGFTLIEVLVSMVIALVIMAGVVSVYVSSNDSYRRLEGLAEVQSKGRFLTGFMQNIIEAADYRGCMSATGKLVNNLSDAASYPYDFTQSIYGNEATGANVWTPGLDASLGTVISGNDSVTVRGTTDMPVPLTANMGSAWDTLSVDQNSNIGSGDILLVSDCKGNADVFQVSSVTASAPNTLLAHATGGTNPGNSSNVFYSTYTANDMVVPVATTAIFLRQSGTGTKVNSLYLIQPSVLHNKSAVELVRGVDGMQILYGVAASAITNTSVVRYATAQEVDANGWWDQVMSVRIEMLVSSDNPVKDKSSATKVFDLLGTSYGPFGDDRLRRKFSTIVTLRNRYLRQ